MPTSTAPLGVSLAGSLRSIGIAIGTLLHSRAELIVVELQEAHERIHRQLILLALGALFIAIGTLLAMLLIVVLLWDTHRLLAISGVTALNLLIGGGFLLYSQRLSADQAPLFGATLDEFANDLAALRGRVAEGECRE